VRGKQALNLLAQMNVRAASKRQKAAQGTRIAPNRFGEHLFDDGPTFRRHGESSIRRTGRRLKS